MGLPNGVHTSRSRAASMKLQRQSLEHRHARFKQTIVNLNAKQTKVAREIGHRAQKQQAHKGRSGATMMPGAVATFSTRGAVGCTMTRLRAGLAVGLAVLTRSTVRASNRARSRTRAGLRLRLRRGCIDTAAAAGGRLISASGMAVRRRYAISRCVDGYGKFNVVRRDI